MLPWSIYMHFLLLYIIMFFPGTSTVLLYLQNDLSNLPFFAFLTNWDTECKQQCIFSNLQKSSKHTCKSHPKSCGIKEIGAALLPWADLVMSWHLLTFATLGRWNKWMDGWLLNSGPWMWTLSKDCFRATFGTLASIAMHWGIRMSNILQRVLLLLYTTCGAWVRKELPAELIDAILHRGSID